MKNSGTKPKMVKHQKVTPYGNVELLADVTDEIHRTGDLNSTLNWCAMLQERVPMRTVIAIN